MYRRPRRKSIGSLPFELTEAVINCRRCKLHQYRKKAVIGTGNVPADILFLGEGPSKSDNVTGIPFFGMAASFIDEMIIDSMKLISLQSKPTYYITNIVLCRPSEGVGEQNRIPRPDEVAMCSPLVNEIIRKIKPKVVIFIGDVAEKYYKNELKEYTTILNPSFLMRKGGKGCQYYSTTIKAITEALKEKLL